MWWCVRRARTRGARRNIRSRSQHLSRRGIYIGNPFVSQAVTLEVKCPRVQCPPLECDEKLAVRPEKKACCRQCPATTPRNVAAAINDTARLPRDQALPSTRRTAEEILASGGCKYPVGGPYENGMEWHPRVHSHGEMKCVKCRCKVRIRSRRSRTGKKKEDRSWSWLAENYLLL